MNPELELKQDCEARFKQTQLCESYNIETRLNLLGRCPERQHGFVNCPIYRGSTNVFQKYDNVEKMNTEFFYGTMGNPTVANLRAAWSNLTHAAGSVILPSGLGAVTFAIMSVVKTGDNVLMVDTAYLPTRSFCDNYLAKIGVTTTYYDPLISADNLHALIESHPQTAVMFFESPGSQTFEVQNVPELCAVAHQYNIATIIDNTWATPIFFDALNKGCDISVEAGTKYLSGHSDLLIGLVAANNKYWPEVLNHYNLFGMVPGNEDCFLALRGLRTMYIRLHEAERRGVKFAKYLEQKSEVLKVLHPAFPSCPGHETWKRDFTGSSGVFSFVLKPEFTHADAVHMVDHLDLFKLGFSWGGFESLIMIYNCSTYRTATSFAPGGVLIRVQIGFEDMSDLKKDLEKGFELLRESAAKRTSNKE